MTLNAGYIIQENFDLNSTLEKRMNKLKKIYPLIAMSTLHEVYNLKSSLIKSNVRFKITF